MNKQSGSIRTENGKRSALAQDHSRFTLRRIIVSAGCNAGWVAGLLAMNLVGLQSAFSQIVAVKAGTIITAAGEPISNGVILIRDGVIDQIGTDITIPVEAKVIDASGGVVMPGMIDAHNPSGMSQANERNSVVPFLSVVDSIDPSLTYFEESRRNGITTAAVVPGNSTMIGGQAAIMKTAGGYVDDMLLVRSAGLKISLQPTGGSRMSHVAKLRKELDAAQRKLTEKEEQKAGDAADKSEAKAEDKKEGGETGEAEKSADTATESSGEQDAANEQELSALQKLLTGQSKAFLYCETAMDVGQAFRLMDEYKFEAILVLGQECYQAADEIAKRSVPIILDPTLVYWKKNPVTREEEKIVLPQIYVGKSIPFLFQSEDSASRQSLGNSYLWYQAATAVRYGLPRQQALEALTIAPAKVLGIDKFVGSLEVGKDADLIILTGDPLDVTTWIEKTMVAGDVVYDRATDSKLKLLLEANPE